MRSLKLAAALLVFLGVAAVSFFAVRAVRDDSGAQANPPAQEVSGPTQTGGPASPSETFSGPQAPPQGPFDEEKKEPRFTGDLLGYYIVPYHDSPVPDQYVTPEDICGDVTQHDLVPWEEAGVLNLSFQLPPEYEFQPDDMNTGVIACAGNAYAARWAYTRPLPNGWLAQVTVTSGLFTYTYFDAAVSRVKTMTIGGRQAVLIEPVIPDDGRDSRSKVIFPASFGSFGVSAFNLPLDDLLALAEIVAGATSK